MRKLWDFPMASIFASRLPTILMYHGTPRVCNEGEVNGEVFEAHIKFLMENFDFVHPSEVIQLRRRMQRPRIILTFDDGFRNNAEIAAPILIKHGIPAIFFVSSHHAEPGKYLWFSYIRALIQHYKGDGFIFRDHYMDMTKMNRERTGKQLCEQLLQLPNHPKEMYDAIENELPRLEDFITIDEINDRYSGMTENQVRTISEVPLFSIGIHTTSHPFLTKCDLVEARRQISENKIWLENITEKISNKIAYPIGDYDEKIIQICIDLGIKRGYAVSPSIRRYGDFEIPRIGVYSTSTNVLGIKVQWGSAIRRFRLNIG